MFGRILVGIDGTRAAYEAGRQAGRLAAPAGELVLVAVADPYLAMFNRWGSRRLLGRRDEPPPGSFDLARARLEERARESLEVMRAQLDVGVRVRVHVAHGRSWDVLREMARDEGADLVALGGHGTPRVTGILAGSTATELLHDAPCSVLVARPPIDPGRFPGGVVVGVDGSAGSMTALDVARALPPVPAGPGPDACALVAAGATIGVEALARLAAPLRVETTGARPVDALLEAGATRDLLVVGARGLSGLRALGSVSERVAHRCECSVLVVRTAGAPAGQGETRGRPPG